MGYYPYAFAFKDEPIQFWSNESNSWEDSWEWDFGDNSSSTLRSPIHKFSAPGFYTVKLTSANVNGQSEGASSPIKDERYNVLIFNNANFFNLKAEPKEGPVPLPVQFNIDLSVNGKTDIESQNYVVSWLWDFGDESASTEQRPIHTYLTPGTYYPDVRVYLNDYLLYWYPVKSIGAITVYPASSSGIEPNFTYEIIDRNGTYGYSYKFMDVSKAYEPSSGNYCDIDEWLWDFGDGSPAGVERAPTHMFKEPGNYTVTLTVRATACDISDVVQKEIVIPYFGVFNIEQTHYDPVAGFTYAKVDNRPLELQFIDQSYGATPLKYAWKFGDEQLSTDKSPKHVYSEAKTYEVNLTVTDEFGKTNSSVRSIGVPPITPPTAAFNFTLDKTNPLQVVFSDESEGEVYSWQWSFGDSFGSSTQSPTHLFSDFGTYLVTLTVGNSAGSYTWSKLVEIEDPVVKAGFTWQNLGSRLVQFTDTSSGSVTSWMLEYGDGKVDTFSSAGWSPVTHQYAQKGIYPVRFFVSNNLRSHSYTERITVF